MRKLIYVLYVQWTVCLLPVPIERSRFILFNNIWHYSTLFDIIWQYSTLFDNIRHYSTIFNIIRHYSALFDMIQIHSNPFKSIQNHLKSFDTSSFWQLSILFTKKLTNWADLIFIGLRLTRADAPKTTFCQRWRWGEAVRVGSMVKFYGSLFSQLATAAEIRCLP